MKLHYVAPSEKLRNIVGGRKMNQTKQEWNYTDERIKAGSTLSCYENLS